MDPFPSAPLEGGGAPTDGPGPAALLADPEVNNT